MPENWTKNELIAYILLYMANSNFIESNKEKNVIISKVNMQTFQKIHDEFHGDNDYQCIQKIIAGIKYHDLDQKEHKELINDIKMLVYSDGEVDVLEKYIFLFLKKILNK